MWFHAEISIAISQAPGRRRLISFESCDQWPRIDWLMTSRSAADADHVLWVGKPLNGGGPLLLTSIESTYAGLGFRVERIGFPPMFEFTASDLFTFDACDELF